MGYVGVGYLVGWHKASGSPKHSIGLRSRRCTGVEVEVEVEVEMCGSRGPWCHQRLVLNRYKRICRCQVSG